ALSRSVLGSGRATRGSLPLGTDVLGGSSRKALMVEALGQYQYLIEAGMISALLALSQYVVLKAGVFSVAPVGLGAVAAYCTAVLQLSYGLNPWMGIVAGTTLAIVVSLLIAAPLARLRGIFQ